MRLRSLMQFYYKRDRYRFQFNDSSNDGQFIDTYITVLGIYINTEPLEIGECNEGHNNEKKCMFLYQALAVVLDSLKIFLKFSDFL